MQLQVQNHEYEAAFETVTRSERIDPDSLEVKSCKLQAVSMMEKPPNTPEDVWREIDFIIEKRGRTQSDLMRALLTARRREVHDQKQVDALREEIIRRFPDSPSAANERRTMKVEAASAQELSPQIKQTTRTEE